jgi:hypothetical protein
VELEIPQAHRIALQQLAAANATQEALTEASSSRWGPSANGQRAITTLPNSNGLAGGERRVSSLGLPAALRESVNMDHTAASFRSFINERNRNSERRNQLRQELRRSSMTLATAKNAIEQETLGPRVSRNNNETPSNRIKRLTPTPPRLLSSHSPNDPWAEIDALYRARFPAGTPIDRSGRLRIGVEDADRRDFAGLAPGSSSEDDGPIIPRNRLAENRYPSYDDGYSLKTISDPYPPPPPPLMNNSPPVLAGLGKWQNRKAKLWTELNPTISKDNTMGEAARRTKMFAEFAKNRPCMFGVKFDSQTSTEEPLQRTSSFEEAQLAFERPRQDEAISRITSRYGSQRSGGRLDRFKQEAAPAFSEENFEDERDYYEQEYDEEYDPNDLGYHDRREVGVVPHSMSPSDNNHWPPDPIPGIRWQEDEAYRREAARYEMRRQADKRIEDERRRKQRPYEEASRV